MDKRHMDRKAARTPTRQPSIIVSNSARLIPLALHAALRNTERFGNLGGRHAPEETHHDQLRQRPVQFGQIIHSIVNSFDVYVAADTPYRV